MEQDNRWFSIKVFQPFGAGQYKQGRMKRQISDEPDEDEIRLIKKARLDNDNMLDLPILITRPEQDMLRGLDAAWQECVVANKRSLTLEIPMSNRNTIISLYYFLHRLATDDKPRRMIYLVETNRRKSMVEGLAARIKQFPSVSELPVQVGKPFTHSLMERRLVVQTINDYVREELLKPELVDCMFVETSHLAKMISSAVEDYITDSFVRRAQIQCYKLLQAYKNNPRLILDEEPVLIPLLNLVSRDEPQERDSSRANGGISFLMDLFDSKKKALRQNNKKGKNSKSDSFEENEMILLSIMIYVLSYLQSSLNAWKIKSVKNIVEFLNDFSNKTLLPKETLFKMPEYFRKVFSNSPLREYDRIEDTYSFSIWAFFKKIIRFSDQFYHDHHKIFQIRIEKFPEEKKEYLTEDSTSAIRFACTSDRVASLRILSKKASSLLSCQNIACPPDYWRLIYRNEIRMLGRKDEALQKYAFRRLMGVHISKTHSNEDLKFSRKQRGDVESIKMKAVGVLLAELCRIVPDGMVVYFHSNEGLEGFRSEMQKGDEDIFNGMNDKKKVFFESEFEEENVKALQKFKKCCSIGRGGIFILSATSKSAHKHTFYNNQSNCILFIGLPDCKPHFHKTEGEKLLEEELEELERLSIFNMCLNNCINDLTEYKTVIFVGREITSNLEATWYGSFIKKWDEATRDSFPNMKKHYQQMRSTRCPFDS